MSEGLGKKNAAFTKAEAPKDPKKVVPLNDVTGSPAKKKSSAERAMEAARRSTIIKAESAKSFTVRVKRDDEAPPLEADDTADMVKCVVEHKRSQALIFGFDGLEERMAEIQATRGQPRTKGHTEDGHVEVDEDDMDPPLPFPMIHPTSDWKIYWDIWISACIIWSTLTVPFSIGFKTAYSYNCVTGVFFIDSVVDISFVVDVCMVFITAFRDPLTTKLVYSPKVIAKKYLFGGPAFTIDFFSTFPFDIVTSGGCNLTACCQCACETVNIGVPPRIFKLLRIVRLAKLAKLAKLLKLKNSKGKDDDSAVNSTGPSATSTLVLLLVQMFYVAHWVACFRHFQTLAPSYAGALGLEDDESVDAKAGNGHLNYYIDDDWDHRYGGDDGAPFEGPNWDRPAGLGFRLNDASQPHPNTTTQVWNWRTKMEAARGEKYARKSHAYVLSLYWAFTTMTTVGYGDIPVVGDAERGFAIVVMIIGGAFFGYIMGTITGLLENFDQAAVLYREKVNLVKDYVFDRQYPDALSKRIVGGVKYCYSKHTNFDQERLYSMMPAGCKLDLIQVRHAKLIERIPWLKSSTRRFVCMLVPDMLPLFVPETEFLFMEGEIATHLFCVFEGDLRCLTRGDTDQELIHTVRDYKPGDLIGPAALLVTTTQTTCTLAVNDASLYMCPKELLIEALNEFPDIHRRLHRQALQEQGDVDAASSGKKVEKRIPFLRRSSSIYSSKSLEPPEGHDRTDSPPPSDEEEDEIAVKKKKSNMAMLRAATKFKIGGNRAKAKAATGAAAPKPAAPAPAKLGSLFGKAETPMKRPPSLRGLMAASFFSSRGLAQKEEPKMLPANIGWRELWERRRVFHPEAPLKIAWDLFIAGLIVLSVLIATYRLGFEVELGNGNENSLGYSDCDGGGQGCSDKGKWSFLDDVIDALFGLDLLLSFNSAYQNKQLKVVYNRQMIVKDYLKGWFVIDFVSTIPLRHLANGVPGLGALKMLKALRLVRLVKIARVLKLDNVVNVLEDSCGVNPAIFKVITPLLLMCFSGHLLACGFFYTGAVYSRVKCDYSKTRDWATFPLKPEERAGSWLDTTCVYKDYCSNQKMFAEKEDCDKIYHRSKWSESEPWQCEATGCAKKKQREDNCWVTPSPDDPGVGNMCWPDDVAEPTAMPSASPTTSAPSSSAQDPAAYVCNSCAPSKSVKQARRVTQYITSIYWAFTTMTTVGYGDVYPSSEHLAGMVYCICAQVLGTMLFAYVIGVVVSIIMNVDPVGQQQQQAKDIVRAFIKERDLPKPLSDAILHNHHWNQLFGGVFDEPMLLGVLSPHMRNMCYAFAHKETLGKTPTLLYCEHEIRGALSVVVGKLSAAGFAASQEVNSPRRRCREFHMIQTGGVFVQVAPANASTAFVEPAAAPAPAVPEGDVDEGRAAGEILETLGARDQFGFPTLLVSDFKLKVRVVTTAVTHTLYLTRDALDDIAAAYDIVANYIEGCSVTKEEFDRWMLVEGDAAEEAYTRLAALDELRADIKKQQDDAQRLASEAQARFDARTVEREALQRRGSARVRPEEDAGEDAGAAEAKTET